jgi:hypothetical protein
MHGEYLLQTTYYMNKDSFLRKEKEEMLNIAGHKGNANQNHIKIPPHSC